VRCSDRGPIRGMDAWPPFAIHDLCCGLINWRAPGLRRRGPTQFENGRGYLRLQSSPTKKTCPARILASIPANAFGPNFWGESVEANRLERHSPGKFPLIAEIGKPTPGQNRIFQMSQGRSLKGTSREWEYESRSTFAMECDNLGPTPASHDGHISGRGGTSRIGHCR
jgi:hypothetical protein